MCWLEQRISSHILSGTALNVGWLWLFHRIFRKNKFCNFLHQQRCTLQLYVDVVDDDDDDDGGIGNCGNGDGGEFLVPSFILSSSCSFFFGESLENFSAVCFADFKWSIKNRNVATLRVSCRCIDVFVSTTPTIEKDVLLKRLGDMKLF